MFASEPVTFAYLLVRGYARVDDDRVIDIPHERLDDLRRFRAAMAATPEAP